jgi:hypothetical protein
MGACATGDWQDANAAATNYCGIGIHELPLLELLTAA